MSFGNFFRANGKSFVCDVNGFSFVKNSNKYYDDCAKILGNMILRELAPTLHIPWSVPFQLDDPPIVPTTFGKMYFFFSVLYLFYLVFIFQLLRSLSVQLKTMFIF